LLLLYLLLLPHLCWLLWHAHQTPLLSLLPLLLLQLLLLPQAVLQAVEQCCSCCLTVSVVLLQLN
jgi:hypothetical protein